MLRTAVIPAMVATIVVLAACTTESAPTPTPEPSAAPHPIRVVADGFVDSRTGEAFEVRGTNYFNIVRAGDRLEDRFFSPPVFDAERVNDDFQELAERGYTTVRLFLDSCSVGPDCISVTGVEGLNAAYLDSIAETMRIAKAAGIFLILTSNDLPDGGGYADRANRSNPRYFAEYRNSVFLTRAGAQAAADYWSDLLTGLAEAGAPFDAVLAWSVVNEMWVFSDQPPLSLNAGTVRGADGADYDLADPDQRRALVLAGFSNYLDTVAEVIRRHDPGALVTSGFFAPKFPNPTATGGDWYVDTAPLLRAVDLDFFDFHAYPGGDIGVAELAENFGMPAAPEVPVVMGEVGAFLHHYDSAEAAAIALQRWTADSCAAGFDGWLHWGYLRAPVAIGDASWGLTDDDGYLLDALSPTAWPDPCTPVLEDPDLARRGTATASNSLPGEPPAAAIDGNPASQWGSGGDAPQWLEVQLASAATIARVRLHVAQYPAGHTTHEVAVLAAGAWQTVAVADGVTDDDDVLDLLFAPVDDVTAVRVTTVTSPSWVSWRAVEVLAE